MTLGSRFEGVQQARFKVCCFLLAPTRCSNCASVLQSMEEQMHRANQMKVEQVKAKEKHNQDVKQMKQTVKVAASDKDDPLLSAGREPFPKSHIKNGLV